MSPTTQPIAADGSRAPADIIYSPNVTLVTTHSQKSTDPCPPNRSE
jgi:hypothetical protein